jgi:hypothetical protein
MGTNPIEQVERAQVLFEKGPITAVAAFFAIAFFVALLLLLRTKDKSQLAQSKLQTDQAKEISRLTEKHGVEMAELYTLERDRAVNNEISMHGLLELTEDIRFIAFEMRRVKEARKNRQRSNDSEESEGET